MNFSRTSSEEAIFLLRRLHLLVDMRKRHAFDFLASLPDLDLYGPKGQNRRFNEEDLNLDMSNEWELQEPDYEEIHQHGDEGI